MVHKEALDNFTLKLEGYVEFAQQATPNSFVSIMFMAVGEAILNFLNKINQADFFKQP